MYSKTERNEIELFILEKFKDKWIKKNNKNLNFLSEENDDLKAEAFINDYVQGITYKNSINIWKAFNFALELSNNTNLTLSKDVMSNNIFKKKEYSEFEENFRIFYLDKYAKELILTSLDALNEFLELNQKKFFDNKNLKDITHYLLSVSREINLLVTDDDIANKFTQAFDIIIRYYKKEIFLASDDRSKYELLDAVESDLSNLLYIQKVDATYSILMEKFLDFITELNQDEKNKDFIVKYMRGSYQSYLVNVEGTSAPPKIKQFFSTQKYVDKMYLKNNEIYVDSNLFKIFDTNYLFNTKKTNSFKELLKDCDMLNSIKIEDDNNVSKFVFNWNYSLIPKNKKVLLNETALMLMKDLTMNMDELSYGMDYATNILKSKIRDFTLTCKIICSDKEEKPKNMKKKV